MRGQEKDQFGIETSIADRLRAAGDLEKSLRIKEEQETKAAARASAHYELPARVIGRAFVDINRRIQPNMTYVFEGGRGGLKSSYISLKIVELLKKQPDDARLYHPQDGQHPEGQRVCPDEMGDQ